MSVGKYVRKTLNRRCWAISLATRWILVWERIDLRCFCHAGRQMREGIENSVVVDQDFASGEVKICDDMQRYKWVVSLVQVLGESRVRSSDFIQIQSVCAELMSLRQGSQRLSKESRGSGAGWHIDMRDFEISIGWIAGNCDKRNNAFEQTISYICRMVFPRF
jgi:hypothetical protein